MKTTFHPRFSAHVALAALAVIGCGPSVGPGYPAQGAAADPAAPESPEELQAIVQASHADVTQSFAGYGVKPTENRPTSRFNYLLAGYGAPDAPAATTTAVIEGPVMGHDPQVAVGEHFVIVYGAHHYEVRDKATGHILPSAGSDAVPAAGDFNTLFAPVWQPKDLRGTANGQSINHRLRFASTDHLVCNPEAPDQHTACVQEFYDTRIMWDGLRKRFWVESAARNHLWFCDKDKDCDDKEGTKQTRTQARRYVAIAVSRTEDPRQGFHHYMLLEEYADWPKFAVNEHYLIVGHRTSPNVYIYDADKLAEGNPDHGPVRVAKLGAKHFPGAKWIAPVTHDAPSNGVTWLLGSDGSDKVVPFALVNPDPSRAARPTVVAGPRVPIGARMWTLSGNAIYRAGFLHFVRDEWVPHHDKEYRDLRVVRLPVRLAPGRDPGVWSEPDPKQGFLDVVIGGREASDPPGDVIDYEMPAMDVNAAGDMVVVYSRKGFQTAVPLPPEVRYSIIYHGEDHARPGVLVRRGTTSAVPDINDNGKAGIDLAHAQVDPSDDHTIWVTNAYADAKARWYKQVVAAVRP